MIKTFSEFIKESQEWTESTAVIALFNNGQLLALIREVMEETGLTPINIKEWGVVDTTGSNEACGLIYYFTGEVNEQPKSSDGENSEWQFIDKENLDKIDWVPFLINFNGCDLSEAKFQKSFLHEVWI
jgi:8-oxo-dGTP pyrophosphatase MutT (NUDIX family)